MAVAIAITTLITVNIKVCIFVKLPLDSSLGSGDRALRFEFSINLCRCGITMVLNIVPVLEFED